MLKLGHLDVLGTQRSKFPADPACVNHSIHGKDYPPRNYQFTAEEAWTGVEGKINRLVISYSSIKGTKAESCFETVNIQGGSETYCQKARKTAYRTLVFFPSNSSTTGSVVADQRDQGGA